MNIGYITKQDSRDIKTYSGTHYSMLKALEANFDNVFPYGPLDSVYKIIPKLEGRIRTLYSNKVYKYQYDVGLAKCMASKIDKKIKNTKPDVLLASLASPEVAFLKSDLPLFLTTDATFPRLNNLYESHSNLHKKSIRQALFLEEKAFKKAHKLILPLRWLADSAIKDYNVPAYKIEVVPYGPNLKSDISKNDIKQIIENRFKSDDIDLLFVGVRWEEKGGPFAVEVVNQLNKMGRNATLHVIGCQPKLEKQGSNINIVGFLDKTVQKHKKQLVEHYKRAHLFLLPTKAECIGMSFLEASMFGLPQIGTKVGGVPEAVFADKTGFLISDSDSAKDVAKWIIKLLNDKEKYTEMAISAFQNYEDYFNWQAWGKQTKKIILDSL